MSTIFIIFGMAGDLAKRMLIPALYQLYRKKEISQFLIIGAARDKLTAQDILDASKQFISHFDAALWELFCKKVFYVLLDFTQVTDYKVLYKFIQEKTARFSSKPNILIYCSSSSNFFVDITHNCIKAGIIRKQNLLKQEAWHRIVYEKPFGHNLTSAIAINRRVTRLLAEQQIFRVDHFISNKFVEDILFLRSTNQILQACWSGRDIESVTIALNESIDIEGRGRFYDATGALLDMVQNHMLQILAVVALTLPDKLTAQEFQKAKARVLKKAVFKQGILGQYEGYKQENFVKPDSQTETFAWLEFTVTNKYWAQVPFYLVTGKALNTKDFFVKIKFKALNAPSNELTIPLQHDKLSNFTLAINILDPQHENHIKQLALKFPCGRMLPEAPQAYETVLSQLLQGNRIMSISFAEIRASWRIIDYIKSLNLKLYSYKKNTTGPAIK